MDKVKLEIKKGEAVIKEGGSSFIGKLMAKAGNVRIHKPGVNRAVSIVKAHQAEPIKAKKKVKK